VAVLVVTFLVWAMPLPMATEVVQPAPSGCNVQEEMVPELQAGPAVIKMVASLALVIALMLGLAWVAKRVHPLQRFTGHKGTLVLEQTLPLGQRKALIVARFGEEQVLLGMTDHTITFLTSRPVMEEPSFPESKDQRRAGNAEVPS
jgi:flagellar protein FliO/FliZ